MDVKEECIPFRGVIICCYGGYMLFRGLYAVQEGYMLFRRVICCSGGLNAVQEDYMDAQEGQDLSILSCHTNF